MRLANKFCVWRWDALITHPAFKLLRAGLARLANEDEKFLAILKEEANNYFRRVGRTPSPERERSSIQYLIEEVAVSELCARHFPANEIYPGPRLPAETYLAAHPNLAKRYCLARVPFVSVSVIQNEGPHAQQG